MKQGVLLKEKNSETNELKPTALLEIMKISLFLLAWAKILEKSNQIDQG